MALKTLVLFISLFILSFIESWFAKISSRQCPSQTERAGELKFWENVHPPPCVTCHISHVRCHMSEFIFHNCGASRCRVCYQRNLTNLVFIQLWSILGYLKYTYMSKHIKVFAFDQYLNHLNGGRGAPPLCLNCIYLMETLSIFDVWLLQTDFLSTAFIMQRFLHV